MLKLRNIIPKSKQTNGQQQQNTIKRMKRQYMVWENIFQIFSI